MNTRTFRLIAILGLLLLSTAACEAPTSAPTSQPTLMVADPNALTIATSDEMAPLLGTLATQFNSQQSGKAGLLPVKIVSISPSDMVAAALLPDPPFQAINPDSGIWLSQLTNQWAAKFQTETQGSDSLPLPRQRYAQPERFAVSPVVIAMWEKVAASMGWPNAAIGWNTLQQRATQDANFHWNHPSTSYASGLLASLAEFYAGAGVNRGLTEAQATNEATLNYVKNLEATLRFYGEGESAILDRLKTDGPSLLDAFVAQEQIVLRWNKENPSQKLAAIYPVEGTLWADHPLTLLERYSDYDHVALSSAQRDTYYAFAASILGSAAQNQVLASGFRPVNTSIDLQGDASPFKSNPDVNALEPKTTLQIPPYSVVQVIEDFRSYIKKPTNVVLVVDTSGSMSDESKLPKVKDALVSFVGQISGKKDRVSLITFSSGINLNTGLQTLTDTYKGTLTDQIRGLNAGGNTAILDAVLEAYNQIQDLGDSSAINAIVVMTDGIENASTHTNLNGLANTLSGGKVPVVVFSIAFGSDADTSIMKRLADVTKGQFRQADSFNIQDLYKIISTYL
jgi:Ca-activated chloride channel family protein